MNKIDELKKRELEILDKISDICKKNNINCYLGYGTLLGAVRHKGFIPWDDDIDLFMSGQDIIKLKNNFNNLFNKNYYFQDKTTDKYYYNFWPKIGIENTTWMPKNYLVNCKYGICVDIFPIFYFKKTKRNMKKLNFYYKILKCSASKYYVIKNINGNYSKYKIIIQKILPNFVNNFLYNYSFKKLSKLDKNSDYVAVSDSSIYNFHIFKKESFEKEYLTFENKKYLVPKEKDFILKKFYGDYMKLPPSEERYGHDIDSNSYIYDFHKSYGKYMKGRKK